MFDRAVAPEPEIIAPASQLAPDVLLDVRSLKKYFSVMGGVLRRKVADIQAVDDVSFFVRKGETLGLVGESGCGKTTLGRTILRLNEPTSGHAYFRSRALAGGNNAAGAVVDLMTLGHADMQMARRDIQVIFQDPNSSLNPRMKVGQILAEPFVVNRIGGARSEVKDRVVDLLRKVGLQPEFHRRFPHEFSGGQRQRIGIARALALRPSLIVADEPVSSLDVSVQGQILNLLEDLQEQLGLTYVFVAHDLSVVEHISDRVAVMYLGRIVELGATDTLYAQPKHPYTEALLSAVPVPDPDSRRDRIILQGSIPSPLHPPSGCRFHTRCRYATQMGRFGRCSTEEPQLRNLGNGQWSACHFAEQLGLKGVGPPNIA